MTQGLIFLALGTEIVILTIGGYFLGQMLDARLGTYPWMIITGVFLGTGVGFYQLFRVCKKFK